MGVSSKDLAFVDKDVLATQEKQKEFEAIQNLIANIFECMNRLEDTVRALAEEHGALCDCV